MSRLQSNLRNTVYGTPIEGYEDSAAKGSTGFGDHGIGKVAALRLHCKTRLDCGHIGDDVRRIDDRSNGRNDLLGAIAIGEFQHPDELAKCREGNCNQFSACQNLMRSPGLRIVVACDDPDKQVCVRGNSHFS